MEYARGRLFKDPSLPGMTAEERKVRVERGGGGGVHSRNYCSGTKGQFKELAKYVNFNELSSYRGSFAFILPFLRQEKSFVIPRTSSYRGSLYQRSAVDVVVYKNAYKFMRIALPSTP